MKKFYFLFFSLLTSCFLTLTSAFAQAPQGINYQAVARDNSGNPLATQAVSIEFKIHQSSSSGTVVYDETYSKTTNQFGLFTAVIGQGSVVSGTFNTITWGTNSYWLEVFVNTFSMGSMQFISVPYAFHARTADSLTSPSASGSIWKKNGGNIFPLTLSDSVGIGTANPSGKLSVLVPSGSADAFNAGQQGTGRAGVFSQSSSANDSACLVSYTNGKGIAVFGINMGSGHGGVFAVSNASSSGYGLVGSTNGTGKSVFGLQTGMGYGGVFWTNNSANDSAALVGETNGMGNAGLFQVSNQANNQPALFVLTNGLGNMATFQNTNPGNTGSGLFATTNSNIGPAIWGYTTGGGVAGAFQIKDSVSGNDALYATTNGTGNAAWFNGKIRISDGSEGAGKVLTSIDNFGHAQWQTSPAISASASTAQSFTANTNTLVHFPTVNYNIGTGTYAGNIYTVPMAGIYHVDASVGFPSPTLGVGVTISIAVNGTTVKSSIVTCSLLSSPFSATISGDVNVPAGQTISIFISTTQGGANTGTAATCWVNAHLVQ